MKNIIAIILVVCICIGISGCGKSEASTACEKLVQAIGEVTLESEQAIIAAEEAYNALSEEQKGEISDCKQAIEAARTTYDGLVAEVESQRKVDAVIKAIDNLGNITLDSKSKVAEAKKAYSALSADEKQKVTNYNTLTDADTKISSLQEAAKAAALKKYASEFKIEKDPVEGVTWYTPKATPKYINTRSYLIPYIGVQNNNAWICICYNYTGDDWVFWESLKIVVDGKTYTKHVGAFNTVRDNDYGDVWEYYDEALSIGQPMDSEEITMLKEIANSSSTIVRFQGDDYHYDLKVKQSDKDTIKTVLAMYEAFANG